MKKQKSKFFLFGLVFLLLPWNIQAQFRNNTNVSFFSGGTVSQQNVNNVGGWYGVYAEWMPIRTQTGFNAGLAFVASSVDFKSNDLKNKYNGSSTDFGLGLVIGKYNEFFSQNFASYIGANVLLKRSKDTGIGYSILENNQLGNYKMSQEDWLISTELNINFLKTFGWRERLFPRTQLRLVAQFPIKSKRDSYWNNDPILNSAMWNKTAYSAELKQSILRSNGFDNFFETKLFTGYYYYRGNKASWIGFGPEFSLKKEGRDDYIALYFLVKKQVGHFEPHLSATQFVIGLNFMPSNLSRW